jgi:hypothetical protein
VLSPLAVEGHDYASSTGLELSTMACGLPLDERSRIGHRVPTKSLGSWLHLRCRRTRQTGARRGAGVHDMGRGPGHDSRRGFCIRAERALAFGMGRMTPRLVVSLLLGGALVLPSAVRVLADDAVTDGPPDTTTPAATGDEGAVDTLSFACGIQRATFKNGGPNRATFTCWVRNAPASDATFAVEVVQKSDAAGDSQALGAASGTLLNGAGTATVDVTNPAGGLVAASVFIAGNLQPSGVPLGPVFVNPTLAAGA